MSFDGSDDDARLTVQPSVLPQLIALGNDEVLRSFAVQLHSDKEFPDCDVKKSVVSDFLSSAISKTTVFKPTEAYLRKEPTEPRLVTPSTSYRLAEACVVAECLTLLPTLIDRVLDSTPLRSMHPIDIHQLLWVVIFPFAIYLINNGAKESCPTHFIRLQYGMVEQFFRWLQERPGTLTRNMFNTFLAALDAANSPEPFVTRCVASCNSLIRVI